MAVDRSESRHALITKLWRIVSPSEIVEALWEVLQHRVPADVVELVVGEPDSEVVRVYRRGEVKENGAMCRLGESILEAALEAESFDLGQYRSVLAVPLRRGDRIIGSVGVVRRLATPFKEGEKAILDACADVVAGALERCEVLSRTSKRAEHMSLLNDLAANILGEVAEEVVLRTVVDLVHSHFKWYDVSIFLVTEDGDRVRLVAHRGGYGADTAIGYEQPVGEGMVGWCARVGETVLANDVRKNPHFIVAFPEEEACRSELCVPLKRGGSVIGVLNIESTELGAFDETDVMAMETVSRLLSEALKTCRTYQEVQNVRQFTETLLESVPAEIMAVDEGLTVYASNRRAVDIVGRGVQVRGANLRELYFLSSQDMAQVAENIRRTIEGANVTFVSEVAERKDDGVRHLILHISPIWLDGKRRALVVVNDVTESRKAEAEARSAVSRLTHIMSHLSVGINTFDILGRYTYWGEGSTRLLGYTAEEMVGKKSLKDIVVGEFDLEAYLSYCLDRGGGEMELTVRTKDGRELTVLESCVPLRSEWGEYVGFTDYLLDITERRKAEEAVRQEKQKLDQIVRAAEAGLAVLNLDCTVEWINEKVLEWFDVPDFRIGITCEEIYRDRVSCDEICKKGLRERKTWTSGYTQKGGALRYFRHTVAPLLDAQGNVHQILRITWDVTEEEQKIQELSLLSKLGEVMQGEVALNRLLHLILTCVTAGPGLGFNRALLFLVEDESLNGEFGVGPSTYDEAYRVWKEIDERKLELDDLVARYNEEEESDTPVNRLLRSLSYPLDDISNVLVKVLNEKRPLHILDAEGAQGFPADLRESFGLKELLLVPLIVRGRSIGLLLVDNLFSGRPITDEHCRLATLFAGQAALAIERAEAYERLEKSIQDLKEAQKRLVTTESLAAIGEMSAHVAHEIRGPLVTIGGYARQMIKRPEDNRIALRNARIIAEEVRHLEQLLRAVLDFTKPSKPSVKLTDLSTLISNTVWFITEEARNLNVTIQTSISEELPPTMVDPDQIRRVLLNLLRNAIEAVEPGSGIITVTAQRIDDTITLSVEDNGIGIPPKDLPQIFNPFFTTKERGTGLGLAMVNKIILDHDGRIEVHSQPDRGSRFTVYLPIREEAPPDVEG